MSHLRWLQVADDALTFAVRVVDDDLDRVHALDRATSRRPTSAHELPQLGAQVVVERLVKTHSYEVALVRSQPEPAVTEKRDMNASADQPSGAIGATQAAAPVGAKRAHGDRQDVGARHPGPIAARARRQGAQSNRNTHDGLLY